jgi:catechol 2,3-dioxygenase-like lactoylglutathione lyase family enzyme
MSRVQLALNVSDLEASVAFYSTLLQVEPHKRRPGYVNFEVAEPALKLVLIETPQEARGSGVTGALNHLGIEVESPAQVHDALARMQTGGLAVTEEMDTNCCYAEQDKVWVHDPAGTPWEVYTITNDNPVRLVGVDRTSTRTDDACCTPQQGALTVGPPAEAASNCC